MDGKKVQFSGGDGFGTLSDQIAAFGGYLQPIGDDRWKGSTNTSLRMGTPTRTLTWFCGEYCVNQLQHTPSGRLSFTLGVILHDAA